VVLVVAGLVIGFLPLVPDVSLRPEVVGATGSSERDLDLEEARLHGG
jgi:hypothetical protein